jgi:flagellin-specific chaperone FliS
MGNMANIIDFPRFGLKTAEEITQISKIVTFELLKSLREEHKLETKDIAFLRDFTMIRKLVEAALLRQLGMQTMFIRFLDDILAQWVEEDK